MIALRVMIYFVCVVFCILISDTRSMSNRICSLFFFKQKTAYDMRISDWSSDVCSSDLVAGLLRTFQPARSRPPALGVAPDRGYQGASVRALHQDASLDDGRHLRHAHEHARPVERPGRARPARQSTRLNPSHKCATRMPSYA